MWTEWSLCDIQNRSCNLEKEGGYDMFIAQHPFIDFKKTTDHSISLFLE